MDAEGKLIELLVKYLPSDELEKAKDLLEEIKREVTYNALIDE